MEIWAHRGSSAEFPENTMIAFVEAQRCGADAIELDVQRTSDGELIVIHDESLNRTTNGRGYVYASSYAWIKTLDAGGRFHSRFQGEKVPTLREVLDYIRTTDMRLNIELKNEQIMYDGMEMQVVKLLELFKLTDKVVISSFNHSSVRMIKKQVPYIETALLTRAFSNYPPSYARQLGLDAIHPSKRSVNLNFMREAIQNQIQVRPYTVNEQSLFRVFDSLGVAAIITNHPKAARNYLNASSS